MTDAPESSGWWHAAPYCKGAGIRVNQPGIIPPTQQGFLYAEDQLNLAPNWREQLKSWWQAVTVGGHLALWIPQTVTKPEYRQFIPHDSILGAIQGWDCIENAEIGQHRLLVLRKRQDQTQNYTPHNQPKSAALVLRMGGIGDHLQLSSIFPGLKAQGYYTVYVTDEIGEDVLRHDPNIDRLINLGRGQLPGHKFMEYFNAVKGRYAKALNMQDSVEGVMLKMPGRVDFHYSDAARRKLCDWNYVEFQQLVADVPFNPVVRFYPTEQEDEAGKAFKDCIMFCMSGSSHYKLWPHIPSAIVRLLYTTDRKIVLVGAEQSRANVEAVQKAARDAHGEDGRVISLIGSTVRETMSAARHCAVVVGPETGVLNAVSSEPNGKVVLLSHSTPKNLTRDWVNTIAIEPVDTPCHPCHRLHSDWSHCPKLPNADIALCADNIAPDRVVAAVRSLLEQPAAMSLDDFAAAVGMPGATVTLE